MITPLKIGVGYEVECTECGKREDFKAETWGELVSAMKAEGWRYKKVDNRWEHYCPECVDRYREENKIRR